MLHQIFNFCLKLCPYTCILAPTTFRVPPLQFYLTWCPLWSIFFYWKFKCIPVTHLKACTCKILDCHFRDTVWGVLTGQGSDNLTGLVMHEVKEIETWILRLLSAPVPVPGKTRVEVIITCIVLHYLDFISWTKN